MSRYILKGSKAEVALMARLAGPLESVPHGLGIGRGRAAVPPRPTRGPRASTIHVPASGHDRALDGRMSASTRGARVDAVSESPPRGLGTARTRCPDEALSACNRTDPFRDPPTWPPHRT